MSLTVATLVKKDKQIDAATVEILDIYQRLDNRTRLFVMAQVNQVLNHSFEKMATRQDTENYLESMEAMKK